MDTHDTSAAGRAESAPDGAPPSRTPGGLAPRPPPRRRLNRWLRRGAMAAIFLLAALAAAMLALNANLGSIAREALLRVGPQATQSRFEVGGVAVHTLQGHASVSRLRIGNPSGFNSAHAIAFERLDVAIDTGSLFSDTVGVEVRVTAPHVIYESNLATSNLDTIKRNVDAYVRSLSATADSDRAPPRSGGSKKRIAIKRLVVSQGKIGVHLPLVEKTVDLSMGDIELRDLGGGRPLTFEEAGGIVLNAILQNSLDIVARSGELAKASAAAAADALRQGGDLLNQGADSLVEGMNALKNSALDFLGKE